MQRQKLDFSDQMLSVLEAAEHLRISRSMVYKLMAKEAVRPIRVGTRVLFRGAELERFVNSLSHAA